MRILKKIPFVLLLLICMISILSISACLPSSSIDKRYFQLHIPTNETPVEQQHDIQRSDKIVLINSVNVEEIYNDYRVVYRTSPYQLNYYPYKYWIKKPEKLIKDCLVEYLGTKEYFKKVITGLSVFEPDYELNTKVHIIEEKDSHAIWWAHLKMDISIRNFKSSELILLHSFDREKKLLQKNVVFLPSALSRILKEELDKVIEKLLKM